MPARGRRHGAPGAAPVPYQEPNHPSCPTWNQTPSPPSKPRIRARPPVRWFREVAPYVHAFRGKTFVVAFGGELVQAGALNTLVQDLSLLSALASAWCWCTARVPRSMNSCA